MWPYVYEIASALYKKYKKKHVPCHSLGIWQHG